MCAVPLLRRTLLAKVQASISFAHPPPIHLTQIYQQSLSSSCHPPNLLTLTCHFICQPLMQTTESEISRSLLLINTIILLYYYPCHPITRPYHLHHPTSIPSFSPEPQGTRAHYLCPSKEKISILPLPPLTLLC